MCVALRSMHMVEFAHARPIMWSIPQVLNMIQPKQGNNGGYIALKPVSKFQKRRKLSCAEQDTYT